MFLHTEIALFGNFEDGVAKLSCKIEERKLALARDHRHQRLDQHFTLKHIKGNRVIRAKPVGSVSPARNRWFDHERIDAKRSARGIYISPRQAMGKLARHNRNARFGEIKEIILIGVPPQRRDWVGEPQTRRFPRVKQVEPADGVALISPRHQRQYQVKARKITRVIPRRKRCNALK